MLVTDGFFRGIVVLDTCRDDRLMCYNIRDGNIHDFIRPVKEKLKEI